MYRKSFRARSGFCIHFGVGMKPIYVAIMIVSMTVVLSTLIVAELSQQFVSKNGMRMITSIGPEIQTPNTIELVIMGNTMPKISFGNISINQENKDLNVNMIVISNSDTNENVVIKLSSFPEGLFPEKDEMRIILQGQNPISLKIGQIEGSGNYKITVSANTQNGYVINSTETYKYIEPVSK